MAKLRKLFDKIKFNKSGETLAETLVALIIIVLAMAGLATSIVSAATLNKAAKDMKTEFEAASTDSGVVRISVNEKEASAVLSEGTSDIIVHEVPRYETNTDSKVFGPYVYYGDENVGGGEPVSTKFVTFMSLGELIDEVPVGEDGTVVVPELEEMLDEEFSGWFEDDGFNVEFVNADITDSKIVWAKWDSKKVPVTFPVWSGDLVYDTTVQNANTIAWWEGYDTEKMEMAGETSAQNAGTYTVTFTPKMGYTWADGMSDARSATWSIAKYDLAEATIAEVAAQIYAGAAITPEPAVTAPIPEGSTTTLSSGTDFEYSYENNDKIGTATITVTAKKDGNYQGSNSLTFTIDDDTVVITYAANPAGSATLSQASEEIGKYQGSATGATATAINGYEFVNWTDASGNVVSTSTTFVPSKVGEVYVSGSYTANFKEKQVTIRYESDANGSVSRESETINAVTGTPQGSTANPAKGYKFTNWTNSAGKAVSSSEAFVPAKIDGAHLEEIYTAHFAKFVHTVVFHYDDGKTKDLTLTVGDRETIDPIVPTRDGYDFIGWYYVDGETFTKFEFDTPVNRNYELNARWQGKKTYYIINNSSGSIKRRYFGVDGTGYDLAPGDKIEGIYSGVAINIYNGYELYDLEGNPLTLLRSDGYISYYQMPECDVQVKGSGPWWCITEGTMITLADGSQKPIEDITPADEVLAFNHITGQLAVTHIGIDAHNGIEKTDESIMNLQFSDGTEIKVIRVHGFFDSTLNEYVNISAESYKKYIGHEFYTVSGEKTVLEGAYFTTETVSVYAPVTEKYMNCFADGVLSMTSLSERPEGVFTFFELDDDMKYNRKAMAADIRAYGLLRYKDLAEYGISKDLYDYFQAQYLNVAFGKNMLSMDEIFDLIETYIPQAQR